MAKARASMQGKVNGIHENQPPNYLNLKYEQYITESISYETQKPTKKFKRKTDYSKNDAKVEESSREDNIHENKEKVSAYHNLEQEINGLSKQKNLKSKPKPTIEKKN